MYDQKNNIILRATFFSFWPSTTKISWLTHKEAHPMFLWTKNLFRVTAIKKADSYCGLSKHSYVLNLDSCQSDPTINL